MPSLFVVSRVVRAVVVMGGLGLVAVVGAEAAAAQSCGDAVRQGTALRLAPTVSAVELQVPAKARQHFERARAASETNQTAVFGREIGETLRLAPRFTEAYVLLAAEQVRERRYEAALATVATAKEMEPGDEWAAVVEASALNELGRPREAAAVLDAMRSGDGGSWQGRFEHARAAIGMRDTAAALHWSELAVDTAPVGCTDARVVRANAFQLAGERELAIGELETFLKLDRRGVDPARIEVAIARIRGELDADRAGIRAIPRAPERARICSSEAICQLSGEESSSTARTATP